MTTLENAETKLIKGGNEEAAITLETFESRWRYAVFPAMIAFIILSAFGFYLIYGMLQRMESISQDITRMTNLMEQSMPVISTDITQLKNTISDSMPAIQENVAEMSLSANSMANSTHNMGQSTWEINRSISKPMRAMNKMIPWQIDTPAPMMYRSY